MQASDGLLLRMRFVQTRTLNLSDGMVVIPYNNNKMWGVAFKLRFYH